MEFRYGISANSLKNWRCFQLIRMLQQSRGSDVGRVALSRIVDLELQSIERATLAREHSEALARVVRVGQAKGKQASFYEA